MSAICLIDTSVFLNMINVPNKNQDKVKISSDFIDYCELGTTFILPMATLFETGNHIAQNGDGQIRRRTAKRFVDTVIESFTGKNPWKLSGFLNKKDITEWIGTFPDMAMRNKAPDKPNEGISFGDLSIIKEYEKCLKKCYMSEIFIWSLDSDLAAYHHRP